MKDLFNVGKQYVLFIGIMVDSLVMLFFFIKLKNREVYSKEVQVKESQYFVLIERIVYI